MPGQASAHQAGEDIEITDLAGLKAGVAGWLTSYRSLHVDGGLGDVSELVGIVLPHVRIARHHSRRAQALS